MGVRSSLGLCCVWTAEGVFWGEVMDETLGCRVISPVSVGAGTTRILNRYGLLNYFWEHEYIQSLAMYQTENKVGIDEWNILKSARTYLAALGPR